jgi:2'-5' RNA ligase
LQERLGVICRETLPIQFVLSRYGFYPWRIVYLDIEKSEAVQKLHYAVMEAVQKYRTAWVPEALLDSVHFNGKQREYIEKFGYQFAGEFYSPHFTLAGNDMTEEKFRGLVHGLDAKREGISVSITKIALIERGSGLNSTKWMSDAR